MSLKHLPGPHRSRRTALKGWEERLYPDHITAPPGWHSADLRGPPWAYCFCRGKWETKVDPLRLPSTAGEFPGGALKSHLSGTTGVICRAQLQGSDKDEEEGRDLHPSDLGGPHSCLKWYQSRNLSQWLCPSVKPSWWPRLVSKLICHANGLQSKMEPEIRNGESHAYTHKKMKLNRNNAFPQIPDLKKPITYLPTNEHPQESHPAHKPMNLMLEP